jgi:hypothetical protein
MGVLKHISSGKCVHLGLHAVAGRAPGCAVRLAHHAASKNHASLSWTGECWEARDLGSTNGTFVDGARIEPGKKVPLLRGAVLRFGSDQERWEIADDRAPAAVARSLVTGEARAAENGLLALPDEEQVLVSVVMDASGQWLIEGQDGSRRVARDEERIQVAGQEWEIRVPEAVPVGTTFKVKAGFRLATLKVRFHVSPSRYVRVEIVDGQETVSLGERAVFSVLLLLARTRLQDASRGQVPEAEQGWMHMVDLTEALRKPDGQINVDVLRIRDAFAKAGVEGAEGIVQRRLRELRLGTLQVEELKA